MKPTLEFASLEYPVAPLGPASCVPDLLGFSNLQNKSVFLLEDTDEIYQNYGRLSNAYPYRKYTCYSRACETRAVRTAVLENEALCAVFLPDYGGRLWSLTDKRTGKNLLYTNDVIRASNLAVRGAWFSGGVEWNLGVIGHTPLTMEPLFTARLETADGSPVLRMYEYERIRGLTYQMDFWLDESSPFLNCRMRVENRSAALVPMYWWSNMAVPEHEGGRVLAPAHEAFTSDERTVRKVDIPMVDGADISRYCDIPYQVDYFFHLDKVRVPYIASLDAQGNGLLHYSTARLQSRKLFSWGKSAASTRWQEYLTDTAGRYVEIQAGLNKTQYGCIPMAPFTAWEWLERYGAVSAGQAAASQPFEDAVSAMTQHVEGALHGAELEQLLLDTRDMAKTPALRVSAGSGYGHLENKRRESRGELPLPEHLDFSCKDERTAEWLHLLAHGKLPVPDPKKAPADFMAGDDWRERLLRCASGSGAENWYVWYQLGVLLLGEGKNEEAKRALKRSAQLCETPWALHALAVCALRRGKEKRAAKLIARGLRLRMHDASYAKEAFAILLRANACEKLLALYARLPHAIQTDGRILLSRVEALSRLGRHAEAFSLLTENGGLVPADLREGEDTVGQLWQQLYTALHGAPGPLPQQFNFNSLPPLGAAAPGQANL